MQRWIVIGVVLVALLLGGGYFGYKTYQANRPGGIWCPIPIRPEVSKDQRDALCEKFETFFTDDTRTLGVAMDLKLANEWSLDSDKAAAAELKRRIFVKQGSTGPQLGDQPSINIGVNGKQKDKNLTEKIVNRMMQDLQKVNSEGGGFSD